MDMIGSIQSVVHPSRVVEQPSTTGGGTSLPDGGSAAPARRVPEANDTPSPAVDTSAMVERLNDYMAQNRRALRFRVDQASGRTVITVVNPETQEVVREIPPEELLALGRWLDRTDRGLVLRARA